MKMKIQYRSSLILNLNITSLLSTLTDTVEEPSYEFNLSQTHELQGLWHVINWSRYPSNEMIPELAEHENGLLALMELIDDFQNILRAERYGVPVPCLVDVESNNYSVRV